MKDVIHTIQGSAAGDGRKGDLFNLRETEYQVLCNKSVRKSFQRNENLFVVGTRHSATFFIESGLIRVYHQASSGKEVTVMYCTAGDLSGGPHFLDDNGYHVWSARVVQDCSALAISGDDLRMLVKQVPAIADVVLDAVTYKLLWDSFLIQLLGTRSVINRLASLLLQIAGTYGVEQNNTFVIESFFTQEDFASMVGATRQWVNKQIKELQKKRVLEIRNRTIVILDLKALEFLAGSSGVSLPNRRVRPTLRVGDDTPISTLLMSRCRLASSAGVG